MNHAPTARKWCATGPGFEQPVKHLNGDGYLCIKTIPERNGLRALGVVHRGRLFELRWCELRLYEEHERLG